MKIKVGMTMQGFRVGLMIAVVFSLLGCDEENPYKCKGLMDTASCTKYPGTICKQVSLPDMGTPTFRCLPGKCTQAQDKKPYLATSDCTIGEGQICGKDCMNMSCSCAKCSDFPGQEDSTCSTLYKGTSYCTNAGACVQCGVRMPMPGTSTTIGCSSTSVTPICDLTTNKCAPCSKHEDCKLAGGGTGICKLPEYGVANTGACVADNEVRVITAPAQLDMAINDAGAPKFLLVRAGTYNAIKVTSANTDKIVVGPGRDLVPTAVISAEANAAVSFFTSGKVVLDGLSLAGSAKCFNSSELVLLRTTVDVGSASVIGVSATDNDCRSLTVGHSIVKNAGKTGIQVGAATVYKIYNSLVLDSAKDAMSVGVQINSAAADSFFSFNTIVRNTNGGVNCSSAVTLSSSIIVRNGLPAEQVKTCKMKDVVLGLTMGVLPEGALMGDAVFAGAGTAAVDYKLADGNQPCCSRTTIVDPKVPIDFFGTIRGRKVSGKTDVGFHEFQ